MLSPMESARKFIKELTDAVCSDDSTTIPAEGAIDCARGYLRALHDIGAITKDESREELKVMMSVIDCYNNFPELFVSLPDDKKRDVLSYVEANYQPMIKN